MDDLMARYESQGDTDKMDEDFWEKYHRAQEAYNSSSLIVDALNAQEAVKAAAEAREQLMRDRAVLEEGRL